MKFELQKNVQMWTKTDNWGQKHLDFS